MWSKIKLSTVAIHFPYLACKKHVVPLLFDSMPIHHQILLASLLGAILYSLIFLVLRGSLKIKSGVKLTLDPNARWHSSEGLTESYHRFIARVAKSMLWCVYLSIS